MLLKFKRELKNKGEIYLRLKARPGASLTAVKNIMDDETIKIDIAAPPAKGMANKELVKFLACEFDVLKNNVKIISGRGDKVKLIKVKCGVRK